MICDAFDCCGKGSVVAKFGFHSVLGLGNGGVVRSAAAATISRSIRVRERVSTFDIRRKERGKGRFRMTIGSRWKGVGFSHQFAARLDWKRFHRCCVVRNSAATLNPRLQRRGLSSPIPGGALSDLGARSAARVSGRFGSQRSNVSIRVDKHARGRGLRADEREFARVGAV